jgi:hypothetical protein
MHDTGFTGAAAVTFRGAVVELPDELSGVPLFYRWYSSLFPAERDRYSINVAPLTEPTTPFDPSLALGTHVITLAASDQLGETPADQNATLHGGATGGSEGDGRCIIHVFKANLVTPANGAVISRANATLEAVAPSKWGSRLNPGDPFQPNPEYHKHNRLQYRWRFEPIGAPAGRPIVDFIPSLAQLVFDPQHTPGPPVVLRYAGPLPAALAGAYTLTLHVEDNQPGGALGGDQVSISVTIIP